jgi:outer membrane lipoprotein-sorting protein
MTMRLSRRTRWAVPGTAVAVTAAVVAALQIPAAQASPDLPARTPAQLLADLSTDAALPPLTGTVVETTSLGLPQLPRTGGDPTSLTSLLTGSHTMKVYYQDASHFRLAIPEPESETDFIADGSKLWLWESVQDSVTEFIPPVAKGKHQEPKLPQPPLTPQQAANEVLKAVGKTTLVTVQANVMVAGEPSYQLVLAPKDHRSLVGSVVIAVDGKYGVPLRVQVFAKGASSPAFQVGYTSLQFVAPNPANFDFTPPPGASVTVVKLGQELGQELGKPSTGGQHGTSGFGTYGQSWLTVVAVPQQDLMQGFGTGSGDTGPVNSQGKQPDIYVANGEGVGVSTQELLNALLGSAKPVSGSWGSGTLVTTSLVSILITGGEVYIGAVEPSVLYAAVGHTSS